MAGNDIRNNAWGLVATVTTIPILCTLLWIDGLYAWGFPVNN